METRPAQSKMRERPPPDPHPATLADHKTTGGIASGDIVYIRARVTAFTNDFDGVRVATCHPVKRNGTPSEDCGDRSIYYVPISHLVRADVVTKEVNGE